MARNLTQKLIADHLAEGTLTPGEEIGLTIDQTLTQDATGTLVMLELEAMDLDRVRTELSAQYVDHNLLQTDYRNPDDHRFLRSACHRFGVWYSPAGNGVSHPVHMEHFGVPGKTLLGSDSHTPAAGSLGMLAIGAGGLEVALAMAGRPYHTRMPQVVGVRLTGELPEWVSAKDVVLEMLRRRGVRGGRGRVFEYYGPGLAGLSAMDRHVIANMGTELGATTSVFPADEAVDRFLHSRGRLANLRGLQADPDCTYDEAEEIDLSRLKPLIACPSSPGNVVPVREVAGAPIYQAMIGSSANPGMRDFAVPALMVDGRHVDPGISFDINPTSREITENLMQRGLLGKLLHAGGRIHQPGCNGCIGMGQAPATEGISLRTVPRNFPGRSGTADDRVYLCSPETATASALTGRITDPRDLDMAHPRFAEPEQVAVSTSQLEAPPRTAEGVELEKGPNIATLPELAPLHDPLEGPVLLKVGDNISTDEILPAGTDVLPYRSNIPAISGFAFRHLDPGYPDRAQAAQENGQAHFLVAGENYGQGSSREHAALAPRYLGLRAVVAKGFARIHQENLANFGILPLIFADPEDYDRIGQGDLLRLVGARKSVEPGAEHRLENRSRQEVYRLRHELSHRQAEMIRQGSLINVVREEENAAG